MDNKEFLDPEDTAWKLAACLVQDFSPFLESSFLQHAENLVRDRNIVGWRTLAVAELEKPYQFKLQMQVCNLFKKFTFTCDALTPNEVYETSVKKFMDNQERLMSFDYGAMSPLTRDVVSWAKGWIGRVLGDFNHLDIVTRATFGKKSSVGIPMRKASEAERYENLTGSQEHIEWFEHYYCAWNRPAHLYASRRASNRKVAMYECVNVLKATLVPKTWKALRMIVPNTTIGSLYTSGLGRLIEDRLRAAGYDIRLLQPIHGSLARIGSIDGSVVTADQALASDNITVSLVEMLLERPWARALEFGRIGKISIDDREITSPTFSTMGTGFTFPLQTLVFLGILYGVKGVMGLKKPVISVFGDDMIYSKEMHTTVLQVFAELGLKINEDKTFSDGYFRESCGSDYFRGFDVRPAHIAQADSTMLAGKRAQAYLYKLFNAVKRRWSADEVPLTLRFLLEEISRFRSKGAMPVPPDYPDTAGVKACLSEIEAFGLTLPRRDIHGTYEFQFLHAEPVRTPEFREWPYYVKSLRVDSPMVDIFDVLPAGVVANFGKLLRLESNPTLCVEKPLQDIAVMKVKDLRRDIAAKLKQHVSTVPTRVLPDTYRYTVASGTTFAWSREGEKV